MLHSSIQGFTALRVFFMLMIFAHHCDFSYGGGGCAVVGFFILSGFCMTLGYGEKVLKENFSWKNFMLRRAIKLYPIHWIGLLLMCGLTGFYFHFRPTFMVTIMLNASLLQSWIPFKRVYFSYNSPSWYLCNILFFAAVFPFIMRGIKKLSLKANPIIYLSIIVSAILLLSIFLPNDLRHAWLYINPIARLADCVIGVFLALWYLRLGENESVIKNMEKNVWLLDVLLLMFLTLVLLQSIFKTGVREVYNVAFWLPESALILLVALRELVQKDTVVTRMLYSKPIKYLGSCSLSFYLLHTPVMVALNRINSEWGANSKNLLGGFIALLITIALSRITYLFVEQRLTKYLTNKLIKV